MFIYILKSTSILALLLLFYKLVLERESIHIFKRFFLLASVLMAAVIPAITLVSYMETALVHEPMLNKNSLDSIQPPSSINYLQIIFWSLYGMGVLFFGMRFLRNLSQLFVKIKKHEKQRTPHFVYVLLSNLRTPHTFFKYIFFDKSQYKARLIPKEVQVHEQAHARQLHSLDVIFIELLQVVLWFNPFIYLLKNSIKLNHEFLADSAVIKAGNNIKQYQNILLNHAYDHHSYQIANALNYSSIKKRLQSMKTKTHPRNSWAKSILILPLLAVLIYGFSEKVTVQQDKATVEQIAEYNELAKQYNALPRAQMNVKLKDVKRLEYIYGKMTKAQKKSAEPFPRFPPPPPPPPTIDKNKMTDGSNEFQRAYEKFNAKATNYVKAVRHYNQTKEKYSDMKALYNETMELYKKYSALAQSEKLLVPPPPPPPEKTSSGSKKKGVTSPSYSKPRKIDNSGQQNEVPPPPPPNPLDHMIELAKKDATFYYEDKKISSDKAIDIVKKNKSINIQVQDGDSKNPIIKLSTNPILLKGQKKDQGSAKNIQGSDKNVQQVTNNLTSKWKVEAALPITFPADVDFYINNKKVTREEVEKLDMKKVKQINIKKDEKKVYLTI